LGARDSQDLNLQPLPVGCARARFFAFHGHAEPPGVGRVVYLFHHVDHRLLEPGLDLFCVSLVALDDDLVVHGEDGQRAQALVPTLVEEREGELQSVRPVPCTGELSLLRSLYL
jgi:hypothetical protein